MAYKNKEDQARCAKRWAENNKDKIQIATDKWRANKRKWWAEYKSNLRCALCGEDHPECLDLHHVDPSEKEATPSMFVSLGWGVARMTKEIEKCQVLCSNCHRKLHWKEKVSDRIAGEKVLMQVS